MIQVVYSNDPQFAQLGLKKVVQATFKEELTPLNSVTLDMSDSTLIDVANECFNLPLGCEKKAVIVKNAFFLLPPSRSKGALKLQKNDSDKPFLDFLSNPDPNIYLYLAVYGENLEMKGKFGKELTRLGVKPSLVNPLTENDWKSFVPAYFEKKGVSISNEAVKELIRRLDLDYGRFVSEGQKLVCYASGSGKITLDDVKSLINEPLENRSYALSNALIDGNVKEAFHIYNDLKIQGYDEVSLLIQLANQFRKMNMVGYLMRQGENEGSIAGQLSSYHMSVYQVKAIMANLRKMKKNAPFKALLAIYQAEKDIFLGLMDAPLSFSLFLAKFPL